MLSFPCKTLPTLIIGTNTGLFKSTSVGGGVLSSCSSICAEMAVVKKIVINKNITRSLAINNQLCLFKTLFEGHLRVAKEQYKYEMSKFLIVFFRILIAFYVLHCSFLHRLLSTCKPNAIPSKINNNLSTFKKQCNCTSKALFLGSKSNVIAS